MSAPSDPKRVFSEILEAARHGHLQDRKWTEGNTEYLIEAHPWNHLCLTYPELIRLQFRSNPELFGASVYRYIALRSEQGYVHRRTEWVWGPVGSNSQFEFGVSVSEFFRILPAGECQRT